MTTESDCVFCGIVAGTVPSTTIAETERAIAFMDNNPVTPGHALVIPRAHAVDLHDVTAEDLAACAHLAQEIAERAKSRLGADGINLLNCSGVTASQTVFHFHVHVVQRFKDRPGKDAIGLPWTTARGNLPKLSLGGPVVRQSSVCKNQPCRQCPRQSFVAQSRDISRERRSA